MSQFTDSSANSHRCNTCCAVFSNFDKLKDHYKGEWHIFNSKRRAHGMEAITKKDFKDANLSKKGSSSPSKVSLEKKEVPARVDKIAAKGLAESSSAQASKSEVVRIPVALENGVVLTWGGITARTTEELREKALENGVGSDRVDSIVSRAVERQQQEQDRRKDKREMFIRLMKEQGKEVEIVEEEEDSKLKDSAQAETEGGEVEMEEVTALLGTTISIFDDREFETTEECLAYMEKEFGFFIPDRDCLEDLEGLLEYLGEKVKLGGFCLYCQRQFRPGKSCQTHMIDKSHCKIAYEEDVDLDEFEDFYDFSEENEDLPVDEDGNPVDAGEAQVLHTGELLMPSGRILGHKMYRHIYKGYYPAEDARPAVMAAKREELIKMGWQVGENYTDDDVVAMPDVQVMSLIVAHRKARRRELMIQQRAQQKDEMRAKRTDHVVKSSKLKSSEQRTQIIRDYHGRLQ